MNRFLCQILISLALFTAGRAGMECATGQDVDAIDRSADERASRSASRPPPDLRRRIHFASYALATPIAFLPGDERLTTGIELECESLTQQGGEGRLSLSHCDYSFNEFGDATILRTRSSKTFQVSLVGLDFPDKTHEGRRLYQFVSAGGEFANRVYFVWSPEMFTPCRLYVRKGENLLPIVDEPPGLTGQYFDMTHILDMNNQLAATLAIEEPIRDDIVFTTPRFHSAGAAPGGRESQGYISVRGTLHGQASLTHDMNHTTFSPLIDGGWSTLMGFHPQEVRLVQRDVEDPMSVGRLLFDVVPQDPLDEIRSYSLVVHPNLSGSHRLIIRKGDQVRHVLPLFDGDWRRYLSKRHQLAETSAAEQRAVEQLWRLLGRQFDFSVTRGRVTWLSFRGGTGGGAALEQLANLPHVRGLRMRQCRDIPPRAFDELGKATQLEQLFLNRTPLSDATLQHLGRLENLQILEIQEGTNPVGVEPSDAPSGSVLTDSGLVHLHSLKSLRQLRIQADKVTPAGIAALRDALPDCRVNREPP